MKIETKCELPKFRPTTLTITLESKEELDALFDATATDKGILLDDLWDVLDDRCMEVGKNG